VVEFHAVVGAEAGHLLGAGQAFEHAGVEVLDEDMIGFVILGLQAQGIGFDAEVDVFGDEDGRLGGVLVLDVAGHADDAAIHGVVADGDMTVPVTVVKHNPQSSAVRQDDPFAQPALFAEPIEHARNRPRVLAALGGFAFEAVDFFDDFDREQDVIVLEAEEGVGVVEENVGVENVILHEIS
jgi:hypothetical protein